MMFTFLLGGACLFIGHTVGWQRGWNELEKINERWS